MVRRRQIYYCTTESRRSPDDWEEWRANALTSAILMPMDIVLSNMALFGLGNRVKILNRVFEPEVYDGFCSMADYMGVSRRALSIRLKQLNLLDRDYLERPYDLVDVYTDDSFDAID